MSVRSKSSSAKTLQERAAELEMSVEEYERLSQPIEPAILAEAKRIADGYAILLERHEDGLLYGRGIEYPYLMGHGKTASAAYNMAREGLVSAIAADLAAGERPPDPQASERTQHIDVVVSSSEKVQLEQIARREGFRGVGDYVRHAALSRKS